MPLPQIIELVTLYCGEGTHDKVYAVVITETDDELPTYELITIDGARTGPKARRLRLLTKSKYQAKILETEILKDKTGFKKQYKPVAWNDPNYGLEHIIRQIGTLSIFESKQVTTGTSVPLPVLPAQLKPTVQSPRVAPKRTVKPAQPDSPWSSVRDGDRDFFGD